MKYVLVSVVLFIFSCKSQKQQKQIDERLTLLVQDGYFPVENLETQVIKDIKSLRAFFSKVNQTRKPGLAVPEVDFNTHSVLVACMGTAKTSAFPMMYLKKESSEEIMVSVQMPDENKAATVQSYPFCVYSLSDEGKKIILKME